MSQEVDDARSVAESLPDAPAGAPTKQSYRSYKKKFAKLKVNFELRMKESESLIREELRIQDLSKRIQEQNDQLLEVLLEFNDGFHISPSLRYDLGAPDDEFLRPSTENDPSPSFDDPDTASLKLNKARAEVAAGEMTAETYRDLENSIKRGKAFPAQMQYTSLTAVPHTEPQLEEQADSADINLEHSLGFFTPEHEAEYYLAMDAKLGDESAALQLSRAPEKFSLTERERDAALRNSISVYNWLRKNQPHIFLQDNENASEKSGSRPSNLRAPKKAPQQSRKEDEIYDDDSVLNEGGPTPGGSKGKRKREEDGGYRPKGGSSRSSRKKKDEGPSSAKRSSKRSSGAGA